MRVRACYLLDFNTQLTEPLSHKALTVFCENYLRLCDPVDRARMRRSGEIHVEKYLASNPGAKVHPSQYPCGFCPACKKSKGLKHFIVSAYASAFIRKNGQFITLTYNEESRPGELRHSDFATFMKDLRGYDGTPDVKLRMAGEYGEQKGREHFHAIIFNHQYLLEHLERAWHGKGFLTVSPLTKRRMKYASGYVDKAGYDPASGKRPPYGRSSMNLPDGLTPYEIVKMCESGKLPFDGKTFNVPEIYRRRYGGLWKHLSGIRAENRVEKKSLTYESVRGIMRQEELRRALRKTKRV